MAVSSESLWIFISFFRWWSPIYRYYERPQYQSQHCWDCWAAPQNPYFWGSIKQKMARPNNYRVGKYDAKLHGVGVFWVIMGDNTVFVPKIIWYIPIHLIKNSWGARGFQVFKGKWPQLRPFWGWGQNFVMTLHHILCTTFTPNFSAADSAADI